MLQHLLLTATVASLVSTASAAEPAAHVHGVALLRVVIDGPTLSLDLDSPLDNLLGFEHAPRSDKEREAVRQMAAKLRQPAAMFTPTPAARCTAGAVSLASAVLPADLLGEPPGSAGAAPDADGHADLDGSFTWQCAASGELKGLEVGLLQAFPGVRTLKVEVVGPRGQSAVQLTAGQRRVAW